MFDGLLEPLAGALRRFPIGGTTAEELLSFEVYSVLLSLANHDRNISGNEARLIREVRYNLDHDISLDVDIPTIRDLFCGQVKQNPTFNVFDRQNVCLTMIASNDAVAGINHTSEMKDMFVRFARAVLAADANMMAADYEALTRFQRHIDRESPGQPVQERTDIETRSRQLRKRGLAAIDRRSAEGR